MKPVEIEVLLHCCYCPAPHPRTGTGAVSAALCWLEHECLIERDEDGGHYRTTSRGTALVTMLCDTPLPKAVYIDPRTGKEVKPR